MIWQMTYTHKLPKLCSATLSLTITIILSQDGLESTEIKVMFMG